MFVQESHTFAVFYTHELRREYSLRTYNADDLYPIWSLLEYRLPTCIVWLYYASSSTMWKLPGNFFLLSVWAPCHTLLNNLIHRDFGSTGGGAVFLHGHAEWVDIRDLTRKNFDSHLRIKVMALWSFPMFVKGSSNTFAILFYEHMLRDKRVTIVHI